MKWQTHVNKNLHVAAVLTTARIILLGSSFNMIQTLPNPQGHYFTPYVFSLLLFLLPGVVLQRYVGWMVSRFHNAIKCKSNNFRRHYFQFT